MRLLYCYVKFLDEKGKSASYRGLEKIEFNFSTVDRFSYDSLTNTLTRKERKCPLPDNFWLNDPSGVEDTTNIYNINVISGENGSGKTTAIHYLIDLLDGLHAAADPAVGDRDRIKKLRIDWYRTLLLFEEEGKQYLLDYSPDKSETASRLQIQNFPEDRLQVFHCDSWRALFEDKDSTWKLISDLLRRTKVIYLTNTLSQHDYERHTGERNERLRDFFVYDASVGSTIGPDISRYFPYEVYKQVRYVFDKNQAEKQLAYREQFPELIMPHALRLHLRTRLLDKLYAENGGSGVVSRILAAQKLPALLGGLCLAACVHDLDRLVRFDFLRAYSPPDEEQLFHEDLAYPVEEAETQFRRHLTFLCLDGHTDSVNCLAAVSDGSIVSGSSDDTLRVWNVNTGKCLHTLKGHSRWITCVAPLSNGRVVSGSDDCTLRVWDTETGRILRMLTGHSGRITCVDTISDDGIVISGSTDASLRAWNSADGLAVRSLFGHSKRINCVAVFRNGGGDYRVVSGSNDCDVRIWDIVSGESNVLTGHTLPVTCVAVLPDGRIVSGSEDGTLRIWDPETGKSLRVLKGHKSKITCMTVLPNGHVVSGSADCYLRVWDPGKGQCLQTLSGFTSGVRCVAALPDGQVVGGSDDGTLRIWDEGSPRPIYTLDERNKAFTCVTVLSDGRVVGGSRDNSVIISRPERLDATALTKAQSIKENCIDYCRFLNEKSSSLFPRFRSIDESTCEVSLEGLEALHSLDASGGQDKTSPQSLYQELITFIEKYNATCNPTYTIDFDWGLSSGEENMLRLFSNLYHIFDPSDSGGSQRIFTNECHRDDAAGKTLCNSVLLFMDEADLTLHPEWQRRLISVLTAFLPQIYPPSCAKDMQLILSTHSPLILGDIPSENITYLPSKKKTADDKKRPIPEETFGQNIHTILKESFFLENGTVGDFAAKKINTTAQRLKDIAEQPSNGEVLNSELTKELEEIRQEIQIVASGVLRARLEQLYRAAEAAVNRRKTASTETAVEKLLSDVQSLSKEQRRWLLKELNKERSADD